MASKARHLADLIAVGARGKALGNTDVSIKSDKVSNTAVTRVGTGAADDLYAQLSKPDALDKLVSKLEQGASFVQTQYCFDYDVIKQYSERLNDEGSFNNCKVIVGMGPLKSAKQADWMRKNLWGVNISDKILLRLEESKSPVETGEDICQELIEKIMQLPCIDGVHLMGPNCEKGSARIISHFK